MSNCWETDYKCQTQKQRSLEHKRLRKSTSRFSKSCSTISIVKKKSFMEAQDGDLLQSDVIKRPLSAVDRLHYRRKSRLSVIREKIDQPQGAVPAGKLPKWTRLNLDDKIPTPNIPNHCVVFSRGKICQELHRRSKSYTIGSENNKIVADDTYNALHDPTTQTYFKSPRVLKQLVAQGLVSTTGEVCCSLVEFNKWRTYLNTVVYNDKVKQSLNQLIKTKAANHAQMKRIAYFNQQESIRNRQLHRAHRQLQARDTKQSTKLKNLQRYEERQEAKAERVFRCKLELARKSLDRCMEANEIDKKRNYQLAKLRLNESIARDYLIGRIVEKHCQAEKRKEMKCYQETAVLERRYLDGFKTQCQLQESEMKRQIWARDVMRQEIREAAATRQKEIEKLRKKQPLKLKALHQCEAKDLVQKYIKKWVNFTNLKKLENFLRPNLSVFHLPSTLFKTVNYLTKTIGLELSGLQDKSVRLQEKPVVAAVGENPKWIVLRKNRSTSTTSHRFIEMKPSIIPLLDFKKKTQVKHKNVSNHHHHHRRRRKIMKPRSTVAQVLKPAVLALLERTAKLFHDKMNEVLVSEKRPDSQLKKKKIIENMTSGGDGDSAPINSIKKEDLFDQELNTLEFQLYSLDESSDLNLPVTPRQKDIRITEANNIFKGSTLLLGSSSSVDVSMSSEDAPDSEEYRLLQKRLHESNQDEFNQVESNEYDIDLHEIDHQIQGHEPIKGESASDTSFLSESSSESDVEVKLDKFRRAMEQGMSGDTTKKMKNEFVKTVLKFCLNEKMNLKSKTKKIK